MYFDFEPHRAHAERIAYVFLPVDDEFLRDCVQNLLVGGDVDRARGLHHAVDIHLADFLVLDRVHAVRVEALDVAARDAGVDLAYLAVGHQLGFFQRALDRVHRGFDIHHYAAAQATRGTRAHADNVESAFGRGLGDDADNFGRTNIESDDEIFGVARFGHGQFQITGVTPRGMRTATPSA